MTIGFHLVVSGKTLAAGITCYLGRIICRLLMTGGWRLAADSVHLRAYKLRQWIASVCNFHAWSFRFSQDGTEALISVAR